MIWTLLALALTHMLADKNKRKVPSEPQKNTVKRNSQLAKENYPRESCNTPEPITYWSLRRFDASLLLIFNVIDNDISSTVL